MSLPSASHELGSTHPLRAASPVGSRRREEADPSTAASSNSASLPRRLRGQSAFTLVEIALSLAIIGFALVAIIGVLPTGLNVQRDNREETIIVHEANYFMDAIRNGARGLDNLTNSIIRIRNDWTLWTTNRTPWAKGASGYDEYDQTSFRVTSSVPPPSDFRLTNGYRIIGLLGRPKWEYIGARTYRSNHVVAYFRALSGAASEKFPVDDPNVLNLAFNYRMIVEVHPVPFAEINTAFARELDGNLKELRLIFRWPLQANGTTGDGRQVFRTMTGGQVIKTNLLGQPLFFFNPTTFVNLKAP